MLEPIQEGLLAGLWLAILVGPLVVIIVQNTLSRGMAHGFFTVLGIWVSDLIYIIACHSILYRLTEFEKSTFFTEWIGLFGGIIVLIIGIGVLFSKPKELDFDKPLKSTKRDAAMSFLQGFSVNTFNPFTVTFWTGAVSTSIAHEGWFKFEQLLFLATILIVIMMTDSLKVYFANHIRKYIQPDMIRKVNKVAGVIIVICGIYLIVKYLIT